MTAAHLVPLGFRFSATSANLRKDGRIDVALAVADAPCPVAARYTCNIVRAAPVQVAAERTASGRAQAVLANSGCANACTGIPGILATRASTKAIADALGIDESLVIPASTGVIGAPFAAEKVIARASGLAVAATPEGYESFAQAICTTDRWKKVVSRRVGQRSAVLGMAKGAGMIHPELGKFAPIPGTGLHATMLAFLFLDAVVTSAELDAALEIAVADSFNCASVDGDTSTNDTVVVMASGKSGETVDADSLADALRAVCCELAESMVRDGEGSEHLAELRVSGASSNDDAKRVARTVATSLLVKTAMAGKDPNWGRWIGAAGRAGVAFDPTQVEIRVDGISIVKSGMAVGAEAEAEAKVAMHHERYMVELILGNGPGQARYLMTDLGHAYVNVNADYRS